MNQQIKTGILLSSMLTAALAGLAQGKVRLNNATAVSYSKATGLPNFIKLNPDRALSEQGFAGWATFTFGTPEGVVFKSYESKKDDLGFTHTRYKEYVNDIPVEGTMLIAHSKEGEITMVNGDYYTDINVDQSPSISEESALQAALKRVGAQRYKWENTAETNAMREALSQPDFSYYPKGELCLVHVTGANYAAENIRLAYKFNIYAEAPLSRDYIFVDANSSEVIAKKQIIHTADVVGTANTKFSGTQTMTSNNTTGTTHRLQESTRGNGIKTYNLSNSTTYGTTDFTNTSATWNITGANQAATDAHWGAEVTYDYYMNVHGRNSIDDAGYTLLSYVHYDVNYANAFWDGSRMTYGDGQLSQGFLIMTALDVCGHEITHGLTENTAGLNGGGNGEPDALNEGFSDIVGTSIEWYARPTQHDWLIGADITCNASGTPNHVGIRNMANPGAFGQPDTYQGTNWDNSGEPHTNNGPSIFWYYLLCQGGTGTNDNGAAYTVSGITINSARMIAFRGLTNYFTPGTTYADARTFTIQAANDIYGGCSPEVIATTNAWHAVGVGPVFSATVDAAFAANSTTSCVLPFNVTFTNTSTNASSAVWSFGDGGTSTAYSPTHSYTTAGTYNVKLSMSGACGTDSVLQSSYITVNPPSSPATTAANSCASPASVTLNATGGGTLNWYTTASGGTSVHAGPSYTTPSISATTTYYVESTSPGTSGNVGPVTNVFGTGAMHNNTSTQYLVFDVLQPCTLQTVYVNSGAAGTRNVMLWNSAGALLQTVAVNFPAGAATVTLNMHLTPGTGYQLGGTSMNLYRNNTGPAYPYSLPGTINITGSSAGTGYYYYFYNWHVQNDPCVSARTPVIATIGGPSVNYTSSTNVVCQGAAAVTLSGGTPAGGTYSGTGVSGTSFSPSGSAGSHVITYSFTDTYGCTGTASHTINVDAGPAVTYSSSVSAVCQDASTLVLSGGTPAGGTYAGTGVSAGSLDPSTGTGSHVVTYSLSDANGCSASATQTITVNATPVVTYASSTDTICESASAIVLAGGAPTGGTYSGAGVSSGSFDPALSGTGSQTITYNYSDANGCSASATQDLYVDACTTTGISQQEAIQGMNVYPNPSSSLITLEFGMSSSDQVQVRVMNALGQIVESESKMLPAGNTKMELSLEKLDAGIYLVELRTSSHSTVQRITKN
jgi:Zn-dependent metalloprotease